MYVCMPMQRFIPPCIPVWRTEVDLVCFSLLFSTLYLGQGLSDLELVVLAGLAV